MLAHKRCFSLTTWNCSNSNNLQSFFLPPPPRQIAFHRHNKTIITSSPTSMMDHQHTASTAHNVHKPIPVPYPKHSTRTSRPSPLNTAENFVSPTNVASSYSNDISAMHYCDGAEPHHHHSSMGFRFVETNKHIHASTTLNTTTRLSTSKIIPRRSPLNLRPLQLESLDPIVQWYAPTRILFQRDLSSSSLPSNHHTKRLQSVSQSNNNNNNNTSFAIHCDDGGHHNAAVMENTRLQHSMTTRTRKRQQFRRLHESEEQREKRKMADRDRMRRKRAHEAKVMERNRLGLPELVPGEFKAVLAARQRRKEMAIARRNKETPVHGETRLRKERERKRRQRYLKKQMRMGMGMGMDEGRGRAESNNSMCGSNYNSAGDTYSRDNASFVSDDENDDRWIKAHHWMPNTFIPNICVRKNNVPSVVSGTTGTHSNEGWGYVEEEMFHLWCPSMYFFKWSWPAFMFWEVALAFADL